MFILANNEYVISDQILRSSYNVSLLVLFAFNYFFDLFKFIASLVRPFKCLCKWKTITFINLIKLCYL